MKSLQNQLTGLPHPVLAGRTVCPRGFHVQPWRSRIHMLTKSRQTCSPGGCFPLDTPLSPQGKDSYRKLSEPKLLKESLWLCGILQALPLLPGRMRGMHHPISSCTPQVANTFSLLSNSWLFGHPASVRAEIEPLDWCIEPWPVILQRSLYSQWREISRMESLSSPSHTCRLDGSAPAEPRVLCCHNPLVLLEYA